MSAFFSPHLQESSLSSVINCCHLWEPRNCTLCTFLPHFFPHFFCLAVSLFRLALLKALYLWRLWASDTDSGEQLNFGTVPQPSAPDQLLGWVVPTVGSVLDASILHQCLSTQELNKLVNQLQDVFSTNLGLTILSSCFLIHKHFVSIQNWLCSTTRNAAGEAPTLHFYASLNTLSLGSASNNHPSAREWQLPPSEIKELHPLHRPSWLSPLLASEF